MRLILLALVLVFMSVGCGKNYNKLRATCKKMCEQKQENNIGSTFMFRDIHATFGKCKCHSRSGKIIGFYISIEDRV